MRKRIFALIVSALAVTLTVPVLALPAFAAPEDDVNETEAEEAAEDAQEEEPQETDEPAEQPNTKPFDAEAFLESYTTATTYDYYGDPYYDTDGNASLISDKHVIYSSDQIQFISVATKDGHVFYIIIDYTDHDGDNVYFLNKVDDFDMYRLLYAGKEDDEDTNIVEDYQAKQGNTDVTSLSGQKQGTVKTEATTPTEPADQQSGGMNIELLMYVGGGALFIIGLVVFFIFRVRSIKNKRIPTDDFDDDDDDDDIYGTGVGIQ